ncbi:hypothetical protein BD749_3379 [Pontibacter ramchanderi]|uniref:Uncharacterized protein n=1 Tax=Pontibacter ramchanderi TaxID=1179743 RepID=A0A2N3U9W9_9BACT|nr:hypothetical protein BD749_3379 [Pontibacter ramchanderi]
MARLTNNPIHMMISGILSILLSRLCSYYSPFKFIKVN